MPRPRKTESQHRAERFRELYRIGKARIDVTDEQIGEYIGMSRPAISRRKKDPGKYVSLDDLVTFKKIFGWSDEDILALFRAGK